METKQTHSPSPLEWPMAMEYIRRPICELPEKNVIAALADKQRNGGHLREVERAYIAMEAQAKASGETLKFSKQRLALLLQDILEHPLAKCIVCDRSLKFYRLVWDIEPASGAAKVRNQFALKNVLVLCERDGWAKGTLNARVLQDIVHVSRTWENENDRAHAAEPLEHLAVGRGWPLERLDLDKLSG